MAKRDFAFEGPFDETVMAFFEKNRIFLRHPFHFDGVYKPGDVLKVHEGVFVERYATLPPKRFLSVGAYSYVVSNALLAGTKVGRYCSIALNVRLMGMNHPVDWVTSHTFAFRSYASTFARDDFGADYFATRYPDKSKPLKIGHDVWIGQDVLIKQGVNIGDGAIVAAGAIVTKDVAPYTIVGGAPARVIRQRFPQELAERMAESQWWRYNFADFGDLPVDQPEAFLDGLAARVAAGDIQPFEPGVLELGPALKAFVAENGR